MSADRKAAHFTGMVGGVHKTVGHFLCPHNRYILTNIHHNDDTSMNGTQNQAVQYENFRCSDTGAFPKMVAIGTEHIHEKHFFAATCSSREELAHSKP